MRTNSIESSRSKNRKHKSYTKQKIKSATDDTNEKESHIFNSVDKIRPGRLATAPVSLVGNIVDMQGSLDHGSIDRNEDEKSENKINNKNEGNKDSNECGKAADNQETNQKEDKDKEASNKDVKNEMETTEVNDASENVNAESKPVSGMDAASVEKEDIVERKSATDETCESSIKQSVSESQGIVYIILR